MSGCNLALLLPGADGDTAGSVGGSAHGLVGYAANLLDHGDGSAHDVNVCRRQFAVDGQLDALVRLDYHQGVRLGHLIPELIKIINGALLHDYLVAGQDSQRLGRPLVDVLLDVAQATDDPVWHPVASPAIAPYRSEREPVVPVRAL